MLRVVPPVAPLVARSKEDCEKVQDIAHEIIGGGVYHITHIVKA
jgi:hypothetical protein